MGAMRVTYEKLVCFRHLLEFSQTLSMANWCW
jgi:hypothetical protein